MNYSEYKKKYKRGDFDLKKLAKKKDIPELEKRKLAKETKDEIDKIDREMHDNSARTINTKINELDENDKDYDDKLKKLEAKRKILKYMIYGSKD